MGLRRPPPSLPAAAEAAEEAGATEATAGAMRSRRVCVREREGE
jgi:hypothetical protein